MGEPIGDNMQDQTAPDDEALKEFLVESQELLV